MNKNVLITGATGFVGRHLSSRLLVDGWNVSGTILENELPSRLVDGVKPAMISPLGPNTDWGDALAGIEIVVHLAARVHIMHDDVNDPLAEFRLVNVFGTKRLAYEAARCGVKRIVFISSVKVNGEESFEQYTDEQSPAPTDFYGVSKWEAERVLRQIESETGVEVVILRPTLVYGPSVKANFLNLMKIICRGIPLPLASIKNKRSLIYIGNLVDVLVICSLHPSAAGKTFLVSDKEQVSTPELIRLIATALGVPVRLFPFPVFLLRLIGLLAGKAAAVNRLVGSLTVNVSAIQTELDWQPPFTMQQGLTETAGWFLKNRGNDSCETTF